MTRGQKSEGRGAGIRVVRVFDDRTEFGGRPIHPKAMPVILTEPAEIELWLTAPWQKAATLQRPLPDNVLEIVNRPKTG